MVLRVKGAAVFAVLYLGAGYSDLWPSINVDSTVRLPGDGAPDCVGDTNRQSASLLTVAQSHEAVGGLPCRDNQFVNDRLLDSKSFMRKSKKVHHRNNHRKVEHRWGGGGGVGGT